MTRLGFVLFFSYIIYHARQHGNQTSHEACCYAMISQASGAFIWGQQRIPGKLLKTLPLTNYEDFCELEGRSFSSDLFYYHF